MRVDRVVDRNRRDIGRHEQVEEKPRRPAPEQNRPRGHRKRHGRHKRGLDRQELEQLENLSQVLNYEYTDKKFDMVTADITSLDGSNWTNVFTINRGTESGISAGDAVVNGMGLVGRVQETGKGWSKVVSLIDEDCDLKWCVTENSLE